MADRTITVKLVGDASSLGSAFKTAGADAASLEAHVTGLGSKFGELAKSVAGVAIGAVAFAGVTGAIKDAFAAAIDYEKLQAQTNAVLKSTGDVSGQTAQSIRELAGRLSDMSGVQDETIQQAANMLLTFTSIAGKTFPDATAAVLDMSASFKAAGKAMSISDIAIQVGKALNDPVKGMTALHRVGVSFTSDQTKVVEAMMKTGDVAGAQAVIIKELNTEFGGSAKAAGDTLGGQLDKLHNIFSDFTRDLAAKALPTLVEAASAMGDGAQAATAMATELGERASPAIHAVADALGKAGDLFQTIPASTGQMAAGFGAIALAATPAEAAIGKVASSLKQLQAEGKLSLSSMSGLTLGVGVLLVAMDAISQKVSGHGLIEGLFGNPQAADAEAAALKNLQINLEALGNTAANKVSLALSGRRNEVAKLAEEQAAYDALTDKSHSWRAIADKVKTAQGSVEAYAKTLMDAHAPIEILTQAHDLLSGKLRQTFDETVSYSAQIAASRDALEKETFEVRSASLEQDRLGTATGKSSSAAEAFAQQLVDAKGKVVSLTSALTPLTDQIATLNPKVIELQGSNALLNKELGDLTAKGTSATAADKARIEVLKTSIANNQAVIDGYQRQQTAVVGMEGAVKLLIGQDALGGLITQMTNAKSSGDAQTFVLGQLTTAYNHLSSGDIPGMIGVLGELKAKMDPAIWATIAQSLGPQFVSTIEEGLSGPKKDQLLSAAHALGVDMTGGVAAGIDASKGVIQTAIQTAAQDAVEAGRLFLESRSPSKLTARVLGIPISTGMAAGVQQGIPTVTSAVLDAVVLPIDAGIAKLQAHMAKLRTAAAQAGVQIQKALPVLQVQADPIHLAAASMAAAFKANVPKSQAGLAEFQALAMAAQGFGAGGTISQIDPALNQLAFRAGYNTGAPLTGAAAQVAKANAEGGTVGTVTIHSNPTFNIQGNADAPALSAAMDTWWKSTMKNEFGYGALQAGLVPLGE